MQKKESQHKLIIMSKKTTSAQQSVFESCCTASALFQVLPSHLVLTGCPSIPEMFCCCCSSQWNVEEAKNQLVFRLSL